MSESGASQNPNGSSSGCGCLTFLLLAGVALFLWFKHAPDGDSYLKKLTDRCVTAARDFFHPDPAESGPTPTPLLTSPPPETSYGPALARSRPSASPARSSAAQSAPPAEEWKRADNWTRAKAKNVDDLTAKDREAIYNWADDKETLRDMLASCNETFLEISSQPAYRYDADKLAEARRLADAVRRCIDKNDPLRIVYDFLPAFEPAVRAFEDSVVWQQGVRHPTAPHVHSGAGKNSWEPDDGYVFASAVAGDLSVVYKGHAHRCSRCKGTGSVVQDFSCPRCQGKGRIPNPLVQGANIANGFADLADAFSKHPRRHHSSRQINDPGIVCPQCHGHRTLRQTVECPDCEAGTVWR